MFERRGIEDLADRIQAMTVRVGADVLECIREVVALERHGGTDVGFESDTFGAATRTEFVDRLSKNGDRLQVMVIGEPGDLQGLLVDRKDVATVAELLMSEDWTVCVFHLSDLSGFVCDASDEGGSELLFDVTGWGRFAGYVAATAEAFDGDVYRRPRKSG